MMTVGAAVARALRILRVLDSNEAPEAEQMAGAIVALNAMAQRWEANGMTLGWSPVDNTADTLPVPAEAEEAIVFNLALKLRAEYGVSIEPDVIEFAREGLMTLRRDVKIAAPVDWAYCGHEYDIRSDSYV